jgi:hypothetical protein
MGNTEGKRPLERPRFWRIENIQKDLRDKDWGGVELIYLAQDTDLWRTLLNTVMNLRLSKNVGKFLSNCTTGGFSRRAQLRMPVRIFKLIKNKYFNRLKVNNIIENIE